MTKATGAIYLVHFRRRREGRTDYAKRLALLKSGKARMVVRKTNKHVIVAFTESGPKGDMTITSLSSKALSKSGFAGKCNTPSAYLTAMQCAKDAAKKGVTEAILDIGLHKGTKGSLVFAAVKGAQDAGIKIPMQEGTAPSMERIEGRHLADGTAAAFAAARDKIKAS
ncbi:MAG: 50S ribosomal protein L18 [Candidatus Micrarchaeota archaeon]